MNVYLNNDTVSIDSGASLHTVLEIKGFSEKKGIAVAVNNSVINRESWAQTLLADNDKILVISATKGG